MELKARSRSIEVGWWLVANPLHGVESFYLFPFCAFRILLNPLHGVESSLTIQPPYWPLEAWIHYMELKVYITLYSPLTLTHIFESITWSWKPGIVLLGCGVVWRIHYMELKGSRRALIDIRCRQNPLHGVERQCTSGGWRGSSQSRIHYMELKVGRGN